MQAQEIQAIIRKNTVLRNLGARYRLCPSIIGYRAVDVPEFRQGLICVPGVDVDIDMVRSLLYKTVAGIRFYYRITGDYMKLYAESQSMEDPEVTDDVLEELSHNLNFVYNRIDVDAVLREMGSMEDMVLAMNNIGISYNVIGLERKGVLGDVHIAVQNSRDKRIYDKSLGIMGVTADEFLDKVSAEYWVDQTLKRVKGEEIYVE